MTSGSSQENTLSVTEMISRAVKYYSSGNLDQAEGLLLQVIQVDPTHAVASHLAGIIAYRTDRYALAVDLIAEAVRNSPGNFEAHENLGNAHRKMGNNAAALTSYDKALEVRPDHAEGYYKLGNFLSSLGKTEEAVTRFQKALALKPDYFEACNNLGNALLDLGEQDRAIDCYQRALKINPNYVGAQVSLGNARYQTGKLEEAASCFLRVLATNPENIEASCNLCISLRDLGRLTEALAVIEKLLSLSPDSVPGHNSHGLVLLSLERIDEAVTAFRKALNGKHVSVEACNNLGNALLRYGKPGEAIEWLKKALVIRPGHASAHNNLGRVFQSLGKPELAVASFRDAIAAKPDLLEAHSNLVYALKLSPDALASDIKSEAIAFGRVVSNNVKSKGNRTNTRDRDKRIRVGIVSGDLRSHVIARLLEPVLSNIDRSRIAFVAYSNSSIDDATTQRLRSWFSDWRSIVGIRDEQVVETISDDNIDILIDLSNHTSQNRLRLFALKPAPVQVTWLGLFSTSGVPEVDYIMSDPWIAPLAEMTDFTEQNWRLPESWFCTVPPPLSIEPTTPPAISNGFITFGCLNNLAKVNDRVVAVWANIINSVPRSRLILKVPNDETAQNMYLERFADQGVSGAQLKLVGSSPAAEYFATYNEIDITLDPFPYSGGMTSLDSLWMAVPVLTRRGDRAGAHTGESIAYNAGLPDWIARDDDDYVELAVAHSSDLQKLISLRAQLRQQVLASPLFDGRRFAHNFEQALVGMWKKYCNL
ncbi:MAG: tetratricopeptide repeat protein [Alphaproteobacteria bacterium]|nr:tetratricopeptide repeat protein [Alphaproteobacteria bacterium]MBT4085259.1 tetratricopeptide repeat protein [Alphaproteobacteria bacterium]MBT4544214.1 tetratricopeptide repeat protein [Alphaproteobacteria bacterium]MBT7747440.1 tetratricopeptide repeat protein [Alphaproteobacteria bacterium]